VSRFRLRYQATDYELREGSFVIGRSSSCDLALDDALVSRRHVSIRLQGEEVVVEDLGSRNGVLVNGTRVSGKTPIRHLDKVTVGSQELVLLEGERRSLTATCRVCGKPVELGATQCGSCGASLEPPGRTLSGKTLEIVASNLFAGPSEVTQQASGFTLLASIADKALALKRYAEAERILGKHLDRLIDRADETDRATLRKAIEFALILAEGLNKSAWLDWVFDIHRVAELVPTAETVDTLHRLVRQLKYQNISALRECNAALGRMDALSPSDRFVLQRMQGLERVISA
jgi:hypothetical protein